MPNSRRAALQAQAAYYIATGLWPLMSRSAFERVTGPKADWWLVQMVGLLAVSAGVTSFAGIDTVHALRGRISKIYLADAVVELALAAAVLR